MSPRGSDLNDRSAGVLKNAINRILVYGLSADPEHRVRAGIRHRRSP